MPTPFLSAGSGPKVRKTVGIDLGTTNSVIALLDAADSSLLTGADEQGRKTFPSVLGWHAEQGRLVAGRPARDLKAPGHCEPTATLPLSSVKRFMGLDKQWTLGPETLTPPQASAVILRHLREMMGRTLNDSKYLLDSAVVTMPAYFNHNQIEATRQAGELAGYEVVELLHEPTAAAIYYSWVENHGDAVYLVYDLGGGTFDVSMIRRRLDDYEVLGVSGDPFLGGDDFDRLLATHLIEHGEWSVDVAERITVGSRLNAELFDPSTPTGAVNFGRLVHVAEGIKIVLTDSERVERYLPGLTYTEGKAVVLEAAVARADFNRLIKDKVDRTIDCCRDALARRVTGPVSAWRTWITLCWSAVRAVCRWCARRCARPSATRIAGARPLARSAAARTGPVRGLRRRPPRRQSRHALPLCKGVRGQGAGVRRSRRGCGPSCHQSSQHARSELSTDRHRASPKVLP